MSLVHLAAHYTAFSSGRKIVFEKNFRVARLRLAEIFSKLQLASLPENANFAAIK